MEMERRGLRNGVCMNVVCPYCHCLGLHKVISHLYGVVKLQCAECKGTFLFERKNDEKVSD
jgi:hypothetical protein